MADQQRLFMTLQSLAEHANPAPAILQALLLVAALFYLLYWCVECALDWWRS